MFHFVAISFFFIGKINSIITLTHHLNFSSSYLPIQILFSFHICFSPFNFTLQKNLRPTLQSVATLQNTSLTFLSEICTKTLEMVLSSLKAQTLWERCRLKQTPISQLAGKIPSQNKHRITLHTLHLKF
jgi:hypothetical protein